MEIIGKKLSRKEFTAYIADKNFGSLPPDKIVLHHTWRPTKEQWKGEASIEGLKNYYEGIRWSDGPHIFVAEDGIWLFTDMYNVGIHAGKLNATWMKDGKTYEMYKPPREVKNPKLICYSIGVEVVGDYDIDLWSGETKKNALHVISELCKILKIGNDKIFYHSDVSSKSCPGTAIKKEWLFKELEEYTKPEHWGKEYEEFLIDVGLLTTPKPMTDERGEWLKLAATLYALIKQNG